MKTIGTLFIIALSVHVFMNLIEIRDLQKRVEQLEQVR